MLNRRSFFAGCACCAAGLAFSAEAQTAAPQPALPAPALTPVADGVWTHTTWGLANGAPFPANGLIIEGRRKIVLVDTGWTGADSMAILHLLTQVTGPKSMVCVGTHAHNDRIGGFDVMRARGIPTYAHAMTQQDAPARHLPRAQHTWRGASFHIDAGDRTVEVFFPGPAHTRDNMVVWDQDTRTLFGGCMIRDMSWTSLGNVADANIRAWPASVATLQRRYGERAARVVPGHGVTGGAELLAHTKDLADAAVASLT